MNEASFGSVTLNIFNMITAIVIHNCSDINFVNNSQCLRCQYRKGRIKRVQVSTTEAYMRLSGPMLLTTFQFKVRFLFHLIPDAANGDCYEELPGERHFSLCPGNYDPGDMTPMKCQARCAAWSYLYAAITQGGFCFCGITLPDIS